jgi:predicted DNA-binding transcriptional regulator AlpA
VCAYLDISRSTLYGWIATRPGFPKPIKIGTNSVVFDVQEIDEFMALRREGLISSP